MAKVFLSPSNQTDNVWCTGDTNESAEAVKFADKIQALLEARGIEVVRADGVKPFATKDGEDERINYASGCDLYMPLHTNAFNGKVKGCRLYIYKTYATEKDLYLKNADAQSCLGEQISAVYKNGLSLKFDAGRWGELTNADKAGIPAVYSEGFFHDNAEDVAWYRANADAFAAGYAKGICAYLGVAWETKTEEPAEEPDVIYRVQVGAFKVKANAEAYCKALEKAGFKGAFITKAN